MESKDVFQGKPVHLGILAAAALALAAGCGGTTTTTEGPKTGGGESTQSGGGTPNFEAEVGALDQDKVQATIDRTSGKLTSCFTDGLRRVPFLGGEIRFALRIGQDGAARVAYLKESTLGDRRTEACMLEALRSASWPAPVGGKEGLADGGFSFDPSPDERPPVDMDPERLGKDLGKVKGVLSKCRESANAGPIKATMYIDTDGKPMSIGVATADVKGEEAASCVVDALQGMKFPSPGSYAGKVSIPAD